MTNKEFKDNIISFIFMYIEELDNLDGEYLELWNKLSDESKQLIKDNLLIFESLSNSRNIIETIHNELYENELTFDCESGNLYEYNEFATNEEIEENYDLIFSLNDYWGVNTETIIDYIYKYELKRGIKL